MKWLVMAFVVLVGCKEEHRYVVRFDAPADLARECSQLSDCIAIPVDCCDCAHGGKLKAALRTDPPPNCKEVLCVEMISNDKSCGQKVACRIGRCVLE